jgi:hypothetical protein
MTVRVAGYPVDDDPGLANLDNLHVTYNNASLSDDSDHGYREFEFDPLRPRNRDPTRTPRTKSGSGRMTFDWQACNRCGCTDHR